MPSVLKRLERFPSSVRVAFDRTITGLADDPRPRGCRKIMGTTDDWRIVVREDYRLLYEINDDSHVVAVYWAGRKEKDIYRGN
jgi:mRNA interferase RelE/StbE